MTTFDYKTAFSRNIGLLSENEQEKLRVKRIAIPGCGGVGSLHALTCARAGFEKFTLADFDRYELANFNRQYGARMSTIDTLKVETIAKDILEINPHADIRIMREGINVDNLEEFLVDVDIVLDSLDYFAFEARDLLFPKCQDLNIPLLTAAPLGFSAACLAFNGQSMRYTDYFDFKESDSSVDKALKFAIGLAPKGLHIPYMDPKSVDLQQRRGPSSIVAINLCAAFLVCDAISLLLDRKKIRPVPYYKQFDLYRGKWKKGRLWLGNKNPLQKIKLKIIKLILKRRGKGL